MGSLHYDLQPDDQLCFIHIMKTAGTTLTTLIDAQFDVRQIAHPLLLHRLHPELCLADPQDGSPEAIAQLLQRYRYIRGGNFSFNQICHLLTKPVYITLLRDPVERIISFYEFIRRSNPDMQREDRLPNYTVLREAASGSLLDFIHHPHPIVRTATVNNQIHKLISPHIDPVHTPDADQWSNALDNLTLFQWIGLTERFQDSVLLLAYRFGWYPPVAVQSRRVAQRRLRQDELPTDVIEAIAAQNQLDLRLYRYAQERFEQEFNQMVEALQREYGNSSDSSNPDDSDLIRWLEQHHHQRCQHRGLVPQQTILFDMRQPLVGTGWHRRNGELNGLLPNQDVARWTGPGTVSTVELSLTTDADRTVRLVVTNAATPDMLDSLSLTVNQHPIALNPLLRRQRLAVLQGVVPKTALTHPLNRFQLQVNRTVSLQSVGKNPLDDRLVGVAVSQIQVFPTTAPAPLPDPLPAGLAVPDDPLWREAVQFIEDHLKPTEQLAAPDPFFSAFPQAFRSHKLPFDPSPTWVVLPKHSLSEIHPSLLHRLNRHRPVLANAVFVVFCNRPEVRSLPWYARELRSFWRHWFALRCRSSQNWGWLANALQPSIKPTV